MASVDDVHSAIAQANVRLQGIDSQIAACCRQTNDNLSEISDVLRDISGQAQRTNRLLAHIARQEDAAICNLEKIARQTCALLNESHRQTGLQTLMQGELRDLSRAFLIENPAAAGEIARERELEEKLERCCPPEEVEPICVYRRCPSQKPLGPFEEEREEEDGESEK